MFESNTDFEFDEIFANDVELNKPETPKRTYENENLAETSKKLCSDWKTPEIATTRSTMFLNKIVNDSKPQAGPSVNFHVQSKARPSFSRQDSLTTHMKKIVLRKFPGPAGLLPERKDFNIENLENKETKQADLDICSQMSVKAFQEGPWKQMNMDFNSPNLVLPDKYNIAWIKSKVKTNKLINQKAPFLAAIVQKIDCVKLKVPVVTMLLKDATGQIHGTIVYDLYEEYINVLKAGSVVILKQFGVLTTDRGSNHYLTITANNLVMIYSQKTTLNDTISLYDEVEVTVVQKLSVEDFLKNINEVKSRHKAALLEQKWNPDFRNVHLNLKPLSEGASSCRLELARRSEPEGDNNKFNFPICRNLSTKSLSTTNIRIKSTANNTSCNYVSSFTTSSKLNQETVSLLNNTSSKPRFNFKARVDNINKNNETLRPPLMGKDPQLENKSSKYHPVIDNTNASNNTINVIKCSQISVTSDNLEHSAILQNVFEGVDADSLFEDF